MTRLLKQFILTAMLALFASQASALFVQADNWDPRMPGVGTNRYAYAGGDPINNSDPNGHNFIDSIVNLFMSKEERNSYNLNEASKTQDAIDLTLETYQSGEYDYETFITRTEMLEGIRNEYLSYVDTSEIEIIPDLVLGAMDLGVGEGSALAAVGGSRVSRTLRGASRACSFSGGTQVLTEDGLVRIDGIVPHETRVWSRDSSTGQMDWKEVIDLYSNEYAATAYVSVRDLETGLLQTITSNLIHPFFVQTLIEPSLSSEGHMYNGSLDNGYWVDASNLRPGYILLGSNSGKLEVVSVRVENTSLRAYNLNVAEFHTYFVAERGDAVPVWVHNNCFGREVFNRLGVNKRNFHSNVKPGIVSDFREELSRRGVRNPDIGFNESGNIIFKDPRTGRVIFETDVPIEAYSN